jgi:HicA toxin of bacterial toxin-antitoxin,
VRTETKQLQLDLVATATKFSYAALVSKRDKLLKRLLSKPTDFTWEDLVTVMEGFDYELKTTGGSGRKFIDPNTRATAFLHEPHPGKILKAYQIRDIVSHLKQEKKI